LIPVFVHYRGRLFPTTAPLSDQNPNKGIQSNHRGSSKKKERNISREKEDARVGKFRRDVVERCFARYSAERQGQYPPLFHVFEVR